MLRCVRCRATASMRTARKEPYFRNFRAKTPLPRPDLALENFGCARRKQATANLSSPRSFA
eukprot:scaffold126307_cov30-Phaeocystis_antarctica.AAC.1